MTASRPPAQAGRFYNDCPDALREEVNAFISAAPLQIGQARARGFISPHAGYTFSGSVAGHVYRQIREIAPEIVFVFAPSHSAAFPLASIWDGPAYATPLGEYPIAADLVARLRRILPGIACHASAESREHSLEVQIPFLQAACPDARLVPLLIGNQERRNVARVAEAIIQLIREDDKLADRAVFLASSDAYHGYSLRECRAYDDHLIKTLEAMDVALLYQECQNNRAMACGYGPIAAVMEVSQSIGAKRAMLLHRATSADAVPGASGNYVVGYLSVMFC